MIDLPIALIKGTRGAAMKAKVDRNTRYEIHALQTGFDD
jgi:hypothetical protein